MGNVIGSFFSGFGKAVGDLFGSPLDFVSGKSCSTACGATWDFICYIENFCVANLLKMAMVVLLLYIVLLFFYLLYKLGICECISRCLCRMIWASFASCFYALEYCCAFICVKLHLLKRMNRRQKRLVIEVFDTSDDDEEEEDGSLFPYHAPNQMEKSRSVSRRRRDYRGAHLRKSLRPRKRNIRAGISRDLVYGNRRNYIKHFDGNVSRDNHGIRITRTSKVVHKGSKYYKAGVYGRKRL